MYITINKIQAFYSICDLTCAKYRQCSTPLLTHDIFSLTGTISGLLPGSTSKDILKLDRDRSFWFKNSHYTVQNYTLRASSTTELLCFPWKERVFTDNKELGALRISGSALNQTSLPCHLRLTCFHPFLKALPTDFNCLSKYRRATAEVINRHRWNSAWPTLSASQSATGFAPGSSLLLLSGGTKIKVTMSVEMLKH